MAVATKRIDNKILKGLQPLDTLSADKIHELAYKSSIEKYYKGEYLFHQGDEDRRTLYLLAGEVELTTDGRHELVKAKSAQARHPLVIGSPRQASARARSSVSVINIDSDLLDMLLHWENPGTYEVAEFSDDDSADWMLRLLNTSLPPSQIQALLGRLEPVDFRAGEVVLHQNQPVERFAFVKAGRFRFSRRSQSDAEPTIVAELGPGEGFGEELLVADPACCADISVVQNGTLLQIGKEDLEELLVAPLVRELAPDAADLILQDNGLLIDVRTSREYQHDGAGANVPLAELRPALGNLESGRIYVVNHVPDGRDRAAALVLALLGKDAAVLQQPLRSSATTPAPEPEPGEVVRLAPNASPATVKNASTAKSAPPQTRAKRPKARTRSNGSGNAAVTQEIARLRAEVETARKQASEEAQRSAQAEAARNQAAAQLKELRTQAQEARRQAEVDTQRVREQTESHIERAIAEAQARLVKETDRAESAEQARKDLEAELTRLRDAAQTDRQRMEEELACVREEAEQRMRAELDDAYQRLESESHRIAAAEQGRRDAAAEIHRLRAEAEHARTEARQATAEVQVETEARIAAELARAQERLDEQVQRARAAEEAREGLESEIEDLRAEAERANRRAREEAERARNQADARLGSEIEEVRAQLEQEAQRVSEAERARTELEDELNQLRAEAQTAREEAQQVAMRIEREAEERIQREIATARARLEEQSRRAEAAEIARQNVEEALIRLREEADQEVAALEARHAAEVEMARREAERIAQSKAQLEADLQANLAAARAQAHEAAQRADAAERTNRQVNAEVARLRAEEQSLRAQAAEAHRRTEGEIAWREAELEALQQRAQNDPESSPVEQTDAPSDTAGAETYRVLEQRKEAPDEEQALYPAHEVPEATLRQKLTADEPVEEGAGLNDPQASAFALFGPQPAAKSDDDRFIVVSPGAADGSSRPRASAGEAASARLHSLVSPSQSDEEHASRAQPAAPMRLSHNVKFTVPDASARLQERTRARQAVARARQQFEGSVMRLRRIAIAAGVFLVAGVLAHQWLQATDAEGTTAVNPSRVKRQAAAPTHVPGPSRAPRAAASPSQPADPERIDLSDTQLRAAERQVRQAAEAEFTRLLAKQDIRYAVGPATRGARPESTVAAAPENDNPQGQEPRESTAKALPGPASVATAAPHATQTTAARNIDDAAPATAPQSESPSPSLPGTERHPESSVGEVDPSKAEGTGPTAPGPTPQPESHEIQAASGADSNETPGSSEGTSE